MFQNNFSTYTVSRTLPKIFTAEVPLASTFGYISDLRTLTSGRASISMKLSHYALVPDFIANTLVT
ncbi:hypothetical protein [Candidatus Chryseobacterium massiliense]|uniref:hypothetical protein n=1 Tax=Candidatus Chryseobacterium massiliense TaxID=204089 RepID=UPI00293730B0|nr:hypothetical protein [Candidatus Chryseobacterium massiliae]